MKRDIVYILKNDISSEEIKYSLRSVCENFPYNRIIFVGGCPKDLKPDVYINHQQTGSTKWERARSSLLKVLKIEDLTEEFFLFNDDFYVLKPIDTDNFINFTNGSLEHRINELTQRLGRTSSYTRELIILKNTLVKLKKDSISFVVHMPLLINKFTALGILTSYPNMKMFRSFYANMAEVPYVYHKDVKIYDLESLPQFDDYLSTTDEAFEKGAIGPWIKNKFPNPCKYEKTDYLHEMFDEDGEERYSLEVNIYE